MFKEGNENDEWAGRGGSTSSRGRGQDLGGFFFRSRFGPCRGAVAACQEAHGDIDFGMNAAGGDRDEDIIEGRGDDGLDVEEDFQDDEADEEKHDLDGLFFRDDALSDDEVADDEDDTLTPEQRKAMKEQARKDREQAALLRGQAPTKRAWSEAEHEEEKNKRRKVESTQMGQHSQAWDHTKAQKPTLC